MDRDELRQRAMIAAMQGLLANTEFTKQKLTAKQVVKCAVEMADALLEADMIHERCCTCEDAYEVGSGARCPIHEAS